MRYKLIENKIMKKLTSIILILFMFTSCAWNSIVEQKKICRELGFTTDDSIKECALKIDQTNTELTQRYAYGVDIDSYGVDWISEKEYELIESIKTMQQRLKIDKLYLANSIGCRYHSIHPRPGWWSCYLKE